MKYLLALLLLATTPAHAEIFEEIGQAFETGDPFEDAADSVEEFFTGDTDAEQKREERREAREFSALPTSSVVQSECGGLPATIFGTSGADRITGTMASDVIVALSGRDHIDALEGNDVVCGGRGGDVIFGGPGFDRLAGQKGGDSLLGGDDDDLLAGQFFGVFSTRRFERDYCDAQASGDGVTTTQQCFNPISFLSEGEPVPAWLDQRANRFGR
jgi:hypothetical protein